MAWVKVDDHFDEHPKMANISLAGMGLWIAGLAYCNRNLTDGFLPYNIARRLGSVDVVEEDGRAWTLSRSSGMVGDDLTNEWLIGRLVESGLWTEEYTDQGRLLGYRVHDFDEYQPTRADVERERSQAADRQRRARERRESHGTPVDDATENAVSREPITDMSRQRHAVTNGPVTTTSPNGHSDPVPDPVPVSPVLADARTGGGEAASEPEVESSRSKAVDRGWEILVGFVGYEPKARTERKGWNGVLSRLRSEFQATDDDIQAACDAYASRWPEMEQTPYALEKHYQRLRETKRASPNGHAPPDEPQYEVFDIGNYLRSERER